MIFQDICEKVTDANPLQGKKLRAYLETCDDLFYERANDYYSEYDKFLKSKGQTLDFAVSKYLHMLADMVFYRIQFRETGAYFNRSFEDVRKRVYDTPEVMEYHMHGLALAQFLWWDQYQRFSFFSDNFQKYLFHGTKYLEVGGGHALYAHEALNQLSPDNNITLVDISQTSLDMSKGILPNERVEFILQDIFDHEPGHTYDFITIGEVLEHLEDPRAMLLRLKELLSPNGTIYMTTPANAPMVDHIYLFNNAQEIRQLIADCGLSIKEELAVYAENMEESRALKYKVPLMYAAYIG